MFKLTVKDKGYNRMEFTLRTVHDAMVLAEECVKHSDGELKFDIAKEAKQDADIQNTEG